MLVLKPTKVGTVASAADFQNLASLTGAALIPAVDFGTSKNGNPDGAKATISKYKGLDGLKSKK